MWIPNFGLMAKPLYEAVKGSEEISEWTPDCQKRFGDTKVSKGAACL